MNYAFAAAKKLYEQNQHPRLFFGKRDLPKLRKSLASGDGKKIVAVFRRSRKRLVRNILEFDTPEALAFAAGSTHRVGLLGGAPGIAMLAILDNDADAYEAVRLILAASISTESHQEKGGQPRLRLGYATTGSLCRAYDMVHAKLTPTERRKFCKWAYEKGVKRIIRELLPSYYTEAGRNIPMNGLLSAVNTALVIDGEDGVPDMSREWADLLPMFEATLNTTIGTEGYPHEDMGYGTVMFARVSQIAEMLRRAGILDPYKVSPRYAEFGNAMLHLVQPWGEHLSTTGDHGDDFGQRVFVLSRLAETTRDPTLLWLLLTLPYHGEIVLRKGEQVENSMFSLLAAHQLAKARHPSEVTPQPKTQYCDLERGIVTFRSGWHKDDTFVVFDGSQRSPAAQGHEHASCGHFSISAFGEYLGIDTGRYNLEQNCHSVVLINGKSGRSTDGEWISVKHPGVLTSFAPGDFVDFASVDSSLQHNCMWAWRHLGFVKGAGAPPYVWVVDDINANNDWNEYWWQLHTSPENKIKLNKKSATITGWRYGNKMDVHFVLPGKDQYVRPHRLNGLSQDEPGTSSYKYVGGSAKARIRKQFARSSDQVHYSTFRRPRLIVKYAGLNGRMMSVMLPRKKNMAPPKVKALESLPGSLAVQVTFDKVIDTVIFAHEHCLLEAGNVSARGHWCVIRRNRKTGEVIESTVSEKLPLRVGL